MHDMIDACDRLMDLAVRQTGGGKAKACRPQCIREGYRSRHGREGDIARADDEHDARPAAGDGRERRRNDVTNRRSGDKNRREGVAWSGDAPICTQGTCRFSSERRGKKHG
jgi:hypothetical protein